jgi:hypothetical protein
MIIRAYRLNSRVTLQGDETYAGCYSWVNLINKIDLSEVTPAMPDAEFEAQVSNIHEDLAA